MQYLMEQTTHLSTIQKPSNKPFHSPQHLIDQFLFTIDIDISFRKMNTSYRMHYYHLEKSFADPSVVPSQSINSFSASPTGSEVEVTISSTFFW